MGCLIRYHWPGNVRELRNVLERSVILADGDVISDRALPQELVDHPEGPGDQTAGGQIFSLERLERDHIARALGFHNSTTLSHAAKALGISRKPLT
jgi:two-component system NtrC family response regulator